MISCSSTFASSAPATSAKVILGVSPAQQLRLGLPEREGLVAAGLHLPEQEDPDPMMQDVGQHRDQHGCRSSAAPPATKCARRG
jgi:hypothetical protein